MFLGDSTGLIYVTGMVNASTVELYDYVGVIALGGTTAYVAPSVTVSHRTRVSLEGVVYGLVSILDPLPFIWHVLCSTAPPTS